MKNLLTKKLWAYQFGTAVLLLILICAYQTWTDWDFIFQRIWFNAEHGTWWLTAEDFMETRWLWYGGAKKVISIFAGICLVVLLCSFRLKKLAVWRKGCILMLISLLLVPIAVGAGKKVTNVYCPGQVAEFNGPYEQHRIFEILGRNGTEENRGACFPAGHCSGGYALLMLFFALPYRQYRWFGLLAGFTMGTLMGGYQIVRGEHFLSDTLATVCIAWIVCLLAVYGVEKFRHKTWLCESPALMDN